MKTIIFEGIASSGKTTTENLLLGRLQKAEIISEDEILMPLIDNTDIDVAKKHLNLILDSIKESTSEYIILDRFHVTHAFRTKSDIEQIQQIESRLGGLGKALIVLLVIAPDRIRERIEETMIHRQGGWAKGGQGAKTIKEKVEYYTGQQEKLRELVSNSTLPSVIVDTTEKEWESSVDQIMKVI